MHASNDFSPRRSVHDRVDASELIQGRDPSTDEVGSATDEPAGLRPQSSTRGRTLAFVALISVGVAAAAPLALLIVLPLGWTEQSVAGALMIAGALALSRSQRSTAITMAMMTLSLFATLRYLYWRTVQT